MEVKRLDYEQYKGVEYKADIHSDRFLSIEPSAEGFCVCWKQADAAFQMLLSDKMLSDWLEDPIAYGAYQGGELIGFVEGFLEKWNNRYRIANICVPDGADRRKGIGSLLMEAMLGEAKKSGARMAVLETQSFNYKAISFYRRHGFRIIGFDRYAYSNRGPEEHNMRIEMGKKLTD